MTDYDFIIIGSGFGGSVSGLRLVEKGYKVLMLEKGHRYAPEDYPKSNWSLRRWLWLPILGCRGLFKMTFFRHLTALSGVGVGGGSLVYANTLPVPKPEFFTAPSWGHLADWETELSPHYETAQRMLGVARNPYLGPADEVFKVVAEEIGRAQHFEHTDVGVYFGDAGEEVPDPYFGGEGPTRTACSYCGGCMLGCRNNAKNTLDKNYLYLAEKLGLEIRADTEVTWVKPLPDGGYQVDALEGSSILPWRRRKKTWTADNVVLSGGVLGSVKLLLKLKGSPEGLPSLSARLGDCVRINSEVLIGIVSEKRDVSYSDGIAIGSIIHTDEHSHMEPSRYPPGSGFFRILSTPHSPGKNLWQRIASAARAFFRHPWKTLKAFLVPDLARSSIIMLYMRTIDGYMAMRLGRGVRTGFTRGLVTRLSEGPAPQASIPEASALADLIAEKIDGTPQSLVTETVLGIPTTAHVLGGCVMGTDAEEGVIDSSHRVFGYDGLYVIDGAAISANPGVNPSLTITAMAERAMSLVPEKL